MPLLSQEQIAERIELYKRYHEAISKLAITAAAMPEECPALSVQSPELSPEAELRVAFVIRRAWPALRKAVLADAEKELADAEGAVLAFERGENVETQHS